jgi:hypothetical protein
MKCKVVFLFSIFVLLIPISLAETSGNISLENITVPAVTGLLGYTVGYCNTTADCSEYNCFLDYDGVSAGTSQGWCYPSSITTCIDDGAWRANGYVFCYDSSIRKWCSSGSWSSETCGNGCVNATCKAAPTETPTSYTNATTTTTTIAKRASISIVSYPANFNITQNVSIDKLLSVKNNGDYVLYNITLELSGIDFYSVSPSKINELSINAERIFTINFAIPSNATVKEYTVTATVSTSSAATATASFKLKVLPSEATVKTDIIPLYNDYLSVLEELETNITRLEEGGINTTDIRALFNSIKIKLNQTNSSLEINDYFTANQLLSDAKELIENLKNMIATAKPEQTDLTILIIVAVIIIVAAAIIAYLFWPAKQGFRYKKEDKKIESNKIKGSKIEGKLETAKIENADVKDLLMKIKERKKYGFKK